MDVYWSTVYPMDVYADYQMLYKAPDSLLKAVVGDRDTTNPGDFFACPAFQEQADNTFIARNTLTADVRITAEGFEPLNERSRVSAQLFAHWPRSRKSYPMLNFDHRLIFFAESSLTLSATPAYLHRTEWQTKLGYIPASFDIARWLRPLQGTFEIMPNVAELHVREDDPLYYIKFHTSEPVKLRRFKMTQDVHDAAHGCVHYKMFRPQSSLRRVYEAFEQSGTPNIVAKAIRANLVD